MLFRSMFAVMLMAGLDGIKNKIDPGDPLDKDLYDLPPEEIKDVPTVCSSLEQALGYLDRDRSFLTEGDVFNDSVIDGYIDLKMEEVTLLNSTTHPVEFDIYYSCGWCACRLTYKGAREKALSDHRKGLFFACD